MRLTPLQENVKRLDRTLPSENKKVAQWVIDNARPHIAIRRNNTVTVCFCCGNAMMYAGTSRYAKCLECGRTVEIVEEQDWLESKRMVSRHFATLEVVDGIQLMRTYEVVLRYSALNRLKDTIAREVCRHWIAPDGRCEVTSIRRYTGFLLPTSKSMKLRRGNTEIEDHLANRAFVLPDMIILTKLSQKITSKDKLIHSNALATIRNLLEPDYTNI